MRWKVAEAKQRFSELLRKAEKEPQLIYNRDRLVGAVIDPETLEAIRTWSAKHQRIPLAKALEELRQLASKENYKFEFPSREDRPNPILTLDEK